MNKSFLFNGLSVLLSLFLWGQVAQADPRFVILLDKNTAAETLDGKIQQALPTLWDRILPLNIRVTPPLVSSPHALLRGIQTGKNLITLELNDSAVWALLTQQGIPMLRRIPHVRLSISLLNVEEKPMHHSERLLAQEAATLSRRWGIVLDDGASEVNMTFSWLDDADVSLLITGSALLSDINENKTIHGDSFVFLQTWLRHVLLQLRDTLAVNDTITPVLQKKHVMHNPYAEQNDVEGIIAEPAVDGTLLVIRKGMTLSQQLLFERAMEKEQRVKTLLPLSFSSDEQRYALQLKGDDTLWLKAWFRKRGMHASKQEQGWLIR